MMVVPLAMDLRTRVLKDVGGGLSVVAAAKYSVSVRMLFAWKSLKRENGSCQPREGKTGPKPKLDGFREQVLATIREQPGIILAELKTRLDLPVWLTLKTWGDCAEKKS